MRHVISLCVALFTTSEGDVTTDTTWKLADSPIVISGAQNVSASATLLINPGVEVWFRQGGRLNVAGQMLALGTAEQPIRFTRAEGATTWDRLQFTGTRESHIKHAEIAFSSGNIDASNSQLRLENVIWSNTAKQLVDAANTSLVIRSCVFPTISGEELLHFSGMPVNGHVIIQGNVFGSTSGYNDILDITGGNRPGPIVQLLDNLFLSAVDDCFDMDGTDAHIEGNIFMNVHQDEARESSSNAVTTGADGVNTSELFICRNIFWDVDHALLLKDNGSAVFQNNTVARVRHNPIGSEPSAVISFGEPKRGGGAGRGLIADGNIYYDIVDAPVANPPVDRFLINFDPAKMFLRVSRSLFAQPPNYGGDGEGNLIGEPRFVGPLDDTVTFRNVVERLRLTVLSPAKGKGPNGLDMGALVPAGASVTVNASDGGDATLTVSGPGIVAFRYRVNDGSWSEEKTIVDPVTPIPQAILGGKRFALSALPPGDYRVAVVGKNSAGVWQSLESPTYSESWRVGPADFAPEFRFLRVQGNRFEFGVFLPAGRFAVEGSPSMEPGTWKVLQSSITMTKPDLFLFGVMEDRPPASGFFRIRREE